MDRFSTDVELKYVTIECLKEQSGLFYFTGIEKLGYSYKLYTDKGGKYAGKPLKFYLLLLVFHHPHSFIPGLKPSFSANQILSTLFFLFRTDYTDSPDCLLILLSISVFNIFLTFSVFHFLLFVPCGRD